MRFQWLTLSSPHKRSRWHTKAISKIVQHARTDLAGPSRCRCEWRRAMRRRPRARIRGDRPAFVYDGPDLYARVVLQADGWHAVLEATHTDLGTFPTRERAILFCNARKARAPAAPIAGERAADATHVKRIRIRQRQAREQRARRAGYAEISKLSPSPACRGRTRAANQPLSGDRRRASTPGVWSIQRPPRIK